MSHYSDSDYSGFSLIAVGCLEPIAVCPMLPVLDKNKIETGRVLNHALSRVHVRDLQAHFSSSVFVLTFSGIYRNV